MVAGVELEYATAADGTLRVAFGGEWRLGRGIPASSAVLAELEKAPPPPKVVFDTRALGGWDSGLITFLLATTSRCAELGVEVDQRGLPDGARRLLALATAVPPPASSRRAARRPPLLARVGDAAVGAWTGLGETLAFVGDASLALVRLVAGKARFRRSDLLLLLQDCGARCLPIVALVNVLVGMVLAFVGATQLRAFGAQIYVADLVGIATVREIAAIMTGVIVTGRVGAAFAAELGTMQTNEEVDALRTLGLPPIDFLVLPRLLALTLMMPLLCVYADLMGIVGGLVVAATMLDIDPVLYHLETVRAVGLHDLLLGLFMSVVFGVIVALTSCMHGLRSGRSAAGVGAATTSAVVTGIVGIVVATAVITVVADVLRI
jgi:phospholipid/cholesterol/gamma-HCH transport system permease protein